MNGLINKKAMENKQQTAVEWLIEQLTPSISLQQKHIDDLKEKAKEMERLQSIDDFTCGNFEGYKGANGFPSMLVNDYINKKYQK
jgi:predicted RNase H-like nuclease (RuvC/YqgF family)